MSANLRFVSVDPYYNDQQYHLIATDTLYSRGNQYTEKTYLKRRNKIQQIGLGALAFFAKANIIPIVVDSKRVKRPWNNATTEFKKKIIYILQPPFSNQKTPQSHIERRTPPLSIHDKVIGDFNGMWIPHGCPEFFRDDEISKVSKIVNSEVIGDTLKIYYSENGKAILLQQSIRGSSAASSAMLILDHKKIPCIRTIKSRDLNNFYVRKHLENSNLRASLSLISSDDPLSKLRQRLLKSGSGMISVIGPLLTGHSIVIDEIAEDLNTVRLRDPYHGWEITVTKEAFLKRFQRGPMIQILP
jgi:hypothetical protein